MTTSIHDAPYRTIPPHGGTLTKRMLRGPMRRAVLQRAQKLTQLELSPENLSNLELLAHGALSPLTGFMGRLDYERVLAEMRLANDVVWPVPVTLAVEKETAASLPRHQEIALCENGRILAVMTLTDKYHYDKPREAELIYQSTDPAHPGVAQLYRQGDVLLGGDVWVVNLPQICATQFPHLRHTPAQTRRMFARRGWRRIVGFQTSTPFHRAHEYTQKTALEIADGLLIQLPVGRPGSEPIAPEVRVAGYETIIQNYYPAENVLLGVLPTITRCTEPREAVLQALIQQNYGCTHFVVSHDSADATHEAQSVQRIFDTFSHDEIAIETLPFAHIIYCKKCDIIASAKTCPHSQTDWLTISDRQVQSMLQEGVTLPPEFTRPEAHAILMQGMQSNGTRP